MVKVREILSQGKMGEREKKCGGVTDRGGNKKGIRNYPTKS